MPSEAIAASSASVAALEIRRAGARAVLSSTHWHEAGHAVVMIALGCPADSATIVADLDIDAMGLVTRGVTKCTAGDRGAISMAGVVVVAEYLKRAGLPCDQIILDATGSNDRANIVEMHRAYALDCDLSVFIEFVTALAKKIIEANWPRVERIAAALLEHETLDRAQIEAAYAG